MFTSPYPTLTRSRKEEMYWDPKEKKFRRFPTIEEGASIHLSVVVPAYEEEGRCKKHHIT